MLRAATGGRGRCVGRRRPGPAARRRPPRRLTSISEFSCTMPKMSPPLILSPTRNCPEGLNSQAMDWSRAGTSTPRGMKQEPLWLAMACARRGAGGGWRRGPGAQALATRLGPPRRARAATRGARMRGRRGTHARVTQRARFANAAGAAGGGAAVTAHLEGPLDAVENGAEHARAELQRQRLVRTLHGVADHEAGRVLVHLQEPGKGSVPGPHWPTKHGVPRVPAARTPRCRATMNVTKRNAVATGWNRPGPARIGPREGTTPRPALAARGAICADRASQARVGQ